MTNKPCVSGEENGPPWTRSGVLIDSVVHTSGPIGLGGPGDRYRPDRRGGPGDKDSPIFSVVRVTNVVCVSRPFDSIIATGAKKQLTPDWIGFATTLWGLYITSGNLWPRCYAW